jgi:hypothetical protein
MEKSQQHHTTRGAPRGRSETTAQARNRARDDMMGARRERPQGEKKNRLLKITPENAKYNQKLNRNSQK